MHGTASIATAPFREATIAAGQLLQNLPANTAAIEACGIALLALPSSPEEFDRLLDNKLKERLRTAAGRLRTRYHKTRCLVGFMRHLGGRAKARSKDPADLTDMHTFFGAL